MISDLSTLQSEEQKAVRRKKYKETKLKNRRNELKARMLDAILCLGEDELVINVDTSIGTDGKLNTEISIQKMLKEWPYITNYEVKFEYKKVKVYDQYDHADKLALRLDK